MAEEEIKQLHRAWTKIMKMIYDRGYSVPDAMLNLSLDSLKQKLSEEKNRECLSSKFSKPEDPESQILVYFEDNERITVPVIAKLAQKMHKESIGRSVLIGKGKVTPSAKQAIQEVQGHFIIEFFEEKEFLEKREEQLLVEYYIVLSEAEKQALLNRYIIKESQLPKIQINNPISRYYGLSRGQVLKIIREVEKSGKCVTYKIAV